MIKVGVKVKKVTNIYGWREYKGEVSRAPRAPVLSLNTECSFGIQLHRGILN
jgi:hypothetical protein